MPILKTKKLNFNIIYKSVQVGKILENDLKNYQTVKMDLVKKYSKKQQTNFLSAAFRTDGKDLYLEKEVLQKHFKQCPK